MLDIEIETNRPYVAINEGYNDVKVDFVRKLKKKWQVDGYEREAEGLLKFHIFATKYMTNQNWSVTVRVEPLSSSLDNSGYNNERRKVLEKSFEQENEDDYHDDSAGEEAIAFVERLVNLDTREIFEEVDEADEHGYLETLLDRLERSRS